MGTSALFLRFKGMRREEMNKGTKRAFAVKLFAFLTVVAIFLYSFGINGLLK